MTRKAPEPETTVQPCIATLGANIEPPTRWLRVRRGAFGTTRALPEPETVAMSAALIADLLHSAPAASPNARPNPDVPSATAPVKQRIPAAIPGRVEHCRPVETVVLAADATAARSSAASEPAVEPSRFAAWSRLRGRAKARGQAGVLGIVTLVVAASLGFVVARSVQPEKAPYRMAAAQPAAPSTHESVAPLPSPMPASASDAQRGPALAPALQPTARPPSVNDAIEELATGHYEQALAAYRALASANPEQPVYAAIATILGRKVALRCKKQVEAGDISCMHD